MFNLNDLLSTCAIMQRQRTADITDRLDRLQQQVASQLLTIRQREAEFISEQNQVLDQIRPLLATDARSLLTMIKFQAFVQSRFQQVAESANQTLSRRIDANPETWRLAKLPDPLQLQDIERAVAIDADAKFPGGRVWIQVSLGTWQQHLFIPIETSQQESQVIEQLQMTRMDLPIEAEFRLDLMQEIGWLLVYIGGLFWVGEVASGVSQFPFNPGR